MASHRITDSEYRLCRILWEHEPIKSAELVRLCQEQLGWKETTTYTVIKRLSLRGVVQNKNTIVTALISKDEVQTEELNNLVKKTFDGSLPAFIAAFTKHQTLSKEEIDAVQGMIDRYRKEHEHD